MEKAANDCKRPEWFLVDGCKIAIDYLQPFRAPLLDGTPFTLPNNPERHKPEPARRYKVLDTV